MTSICPLENCTGCGLCSVLCPQKCIAMQKGGLGHLYPKIDRSKCVDCGLCKKKCPSLHLVEARKATKAFAAWAKDEWEYKSSTSGGVASVLSRCILERSGVVYGCSMQSGLIAKHIRVENVEDLPLLKGSKYVQSSIVDVIPLVRRDVKTGREVLFLGTPCQVAAISSMYVEKPKNLILVDLICHGVPSLALLQSHVYKKVKQKKIDSISFRDEDGYVITIRSQKQIVYRMPLWERRYKDAYFNMFIDGYSCRESCNNCSYAGANRISDLTIGDFWGLGNIYPAKEIPDHPYGISLVLPNSAKGLLFLESQMDRLNIYERPVSEALEGNDQLRGPKRANIRIKLYRKIYKLIGVNLAYYLCELDHILRYHYRVHKIKRKAEEK